MSQSTELYGPLFEYMRRTHGTYMWNLGYWEGGAKSLRAAQENLVDMCLRAMDPGEDQRILDVGCGVGGVLGHMAGRLPGCRFVGITIRADDVVRGARVLDELGVSGRASVELGDAQRIPFEDESFDHVLCLESAFHYPDKPAFLREAFRVLRPGGRLVLADILFRGDTPLLALAQGLCNRGSGQSFCSTEQWEDHIAASPFRRAAYSRDFTEVARPPSPAAAALSPRARLRRLARQAGLPLQMLRWRSGKRNYDTGTIVTTLMRWGILRYVLWVLERPGGASPEAVAAREGAALPAVHP
jgi:SAM-dependent methyltransferase